jgi:hypothetical protein
MSGQTSLYQCYTTFCSFNLLKIDGLHKEVFLNGNAKYSSPPCNNYFTTANFILKAFITFSQNMLP